jgi:quercetin dioxygenase-like cupin family protein
MDIAVVGEVATEETLIASRATSRPMQWLFNLETDDGFALRMYRTIFEPGENASVTPRHHHAFQQIRFAEAGSINFAPEQNIAAGDLAYFPRGTYYGPQLRDNGIGIFLQFGLGQELPGGKDSLRRSKETAERLRALGGRVEHGVYIDVDPETGAERRRDPTEVIAKEINGAKFAIPAAGYESPILLHPAAFSYFDVGSGAQLKHLGKFYDHPGPDGDVAISVIRLAPGGSYTLGAGRAQAAWTTSPGLLIAGRTYPELTAVFSPRTENSVLSASEDVELYVVTFPCLHPLQIKRPA